MTQKVCYVIELRLTILHGTVKCTNSKIMLRSLLSSVSVQTYPGSKREGVKFLQHFVNSIEYSF